MSAQSQALPSTSPANAGMAVSQFENPMGIDGFEFVEFAAPAGQAQQLHDYFRRLGFVQVARHKSRPISTYRQGDCTFLSTRTRTRSPRASPRSTGRARAASRSASASSPSGCACRR